MKYLYIGTLFLIVGGLIGLYTAVSVDFHTMDPDQAKILFHITFLCMLCFIAVTLVGPGFYLLYLA